jgi:GT2 family glycosyltransferase
MAAAPRVAVIVLNYNGLDDTLKCLVSLAPVAAAGHDVILVDNASAVDPEAACRRVLPSLIYARNADNLGYAGGNNAGIRIALDRGAGLVLVLNNDTVVSPDIVRELAAAFESDSTLGIVGPVVNFMEEPAVVMTDGVAFNPGPGTEFFRRIVVTPENEGRRVLSVDIVNGCCMMIRRDVLVSVGLFDEGFFIVHEESDLCLRAKRAGYGAGILARTLVWHKGSSAFERSGRQYQRYYDARNLYTLLRRHTGRVGASRSLRGTLGHYFRYCFYRYDIELEAGKSAAALAVVAGVCDGLKGKKGATPLPRQARLGNAVFSVARLLVGLRRSRKN